MFVPLEYDKKLEFDFGICTAKGRQRPKKILAFYILVKKYEKYE